MTQETVSDEFIYNWLTAGRAAHLCIDNQAWYASKNFYGSSPRPVGQMAFARNLADFTHANRNKLLTVHVLQPISATTAYKLSGEGFKVDAVKYDAINLKATPVRRLWSDEYVDLINPHYAMDIVHFKDAGVWHGKAGRRLNDRLKAENCPRELVTGAFGDRCVWDGVNGAHKRNMDLLVDPSLIWMHHGAEMTMDEALMYYSDKAHITEPGQVVRILEKLAM